MYLFFGVLVTYCNNHRIEIISTERIINTYHMYVCVLQKESELVLVLGGWR